MLNGNVDVTVIQEFIDLKHGVKLKETSIRKMWQTVLMDKFKGDKKSDETTAQTLLLFPWSWWLFSHPFWLLLFIVHIISPIITYSKFHKSNSKINLKVLPPIMLAYILFSIHLHYYISSFTI